MNIFPNILHADNGSDAASSGTAMVTTWDNSTEGDPGSGGADPPTDVHQYSSGDPVTLAAGQKYDIEMDYQDAGTAGASLSWSSASQGKEIIPESQLFLAPPSVSFGSMPSGAAAGDSVTLSSTATPPDGYSGSTTYAWTVYRNGDAVTLSGVTTTSNTITFIPDEPGIWSASENVTSGSGTGTYNTDSFLVNPVAPSLSAHAVSDSEIDLSWSGGVSGENLEIYWMTPDDKNFHLLEGGLSGASGTYDATSLSSGSNYSFIMRADNGSDAVSHLVKYRTGRPVTTYNKSCIGRILHIGSWSLWLLVSILIIQSYIHPMSIITLAQGDEVAGWQSGYGYINYMYCSANSLASNRHWIDQVFQNYADASDILPFRWPIRYWSTLLFRKSLNVRMYLISYVYPWLIAGFLPTMTFVRNQRRRRRQLRGFCMICGYDLRASPDKCPECGAAVPRPADGTSPPNPGTA